MAQIESIIGYKTKPDATLQAEWERAGVHLADRIREQRVLFRSRSDAVNRFLGGGIQLGGFTEWGVPLGRGGRQIILEFVAQATQQSQFVLWIYDSPLLRIYPPSWQANGVNLEWIRFVNTGQPLRDLQQIFLNSLFKIIVFDAPRRLSREDMAFIAQKIRSHGQVVFLLRNYLLLPEQGNVWASLRVNATCDGPMKGDYRLQMIRGLAAKQGCVRLDAELQHE